MTKYQLIQIQNLLMNIASKLLFSAVLFGLSQFSEAQEKQLLAKTNTVELQKAQPQPKNFLLDAKQAKGGVTIKTDQGNDAVYFNAKNAVNDKIVWTIPGSLPAGIYQVDIDFYQPEGTFSPNQIISFEGENPVNFDLYYIGFTKGSYTRSIGFSSDKPVSAISLVKSKQRNLNTVAVRSIRITPAIDTKFENLMFVFQLPVIQQQVSLPISLPTGVYVLNSEKPVAVNWAIQNGETFTTPLSTEHRVFLDKPAQLAVISSEQLSRVKLLHYPITESPDMSSAGNLPLINASDSTKIEAKTLKIIGYKGNEIPTLNLFPEGKTMAMVTSWDDGNIKDLQVMDILLKYGMKGTFYMNRKSEMNSHLQELEAKGMEVGSHSWSHPAFYNSSPKRCLDEAVEMRRFLEKELNHPVISFAYPYNYESANDAHGDYVLRSLREAGYWSGRVTTIGDNRIDSIAQPLAMSPNFHFRVGVAKTKDKFEQLIKKSGSIFYVWGHSYELANGGDKLLEEVLAAVANRPEVWYTNLGELMIWQYIRNHLKMEQTSKRKGGNEFILKMPWLNPYLQKVPVSLSIPEGVKHVLWQGKKIPVVNGRVQLTWLE